MFGGLSNLWAIKGICSLLGGLNPCQGGLGHLCSSNRLVLRRVLSAPGCPERQGEQQGFPYLDHFSVHKYYVQQDPWKNNTTLQYPFFKSTSRYSSGNWDASASGLWGALARVNLSYTGQASSWQRPVNADRLYMDSIKLTITLNDKESRRGPCTVSTHQQMLAFQWILIEYVIFNWV